MLSQRIVKEILLTVCIVALGVLLFIKSRSTDLNRMVEDYVRTEYGLSGSVINCESYHNGNAGGSKYAYDFSFRESSGQMIKIYYRADVDINKDTLSYLIVQS